MTKFKNIFKKMKQEAQSNEPIEENPTNEILEESNLNEGIETGTTEKTEEVLTDWETKYNEINDKFLRLYSEFDNFRKRTTKERIELIKTASSETIAAMLPVIDDFERALKAMHDAGESDSIKEGIDLIYNKLKSILNSKGLVAMEAVGKEFDADLHEAITKIPAPDESMKGKVIDEVEKGYLLGEKVIRYAKVVVGS